MILSIFNFIRTIIGLIDLLLLTSLMYLFSFLPQKLLGKWYRRCFRYWCWIFVRALRVELFLHQKNTQPLPKHFILIGNHPSALEDVGLPALFDVLFLAKQEVKSWFIVGRISKAAGTFYFDRGSKESRAFASETLAQAVNNGDNVGIYPEGGCKGRRIHLPFRYGVFDLSIKTGVPIIPVFLHYESQAEFEWLDQHLLVKLWTIITAQNRRANYYVYDAIDPKQFENKEAYCEYVQNLYLGWQSQYLR